MAEFGENLKRAREKCGMTQQTLADEIFVTRQAVSRWENGSRYPDLMTARKLSEILRVPLDELIKDDTMLTYPQKSPIAEYPRSKRAQTAIFSFCLVPYLIFSLKNTISLFNFIFFSNTEKGLLFSSELPNLLLTFVLLLLFAYGVIMSIQDKITPKIAGLILGIYFGIGAGIDLTESLIMENVYLKSISEFDFNAVNIIGYSNIILKLAIAVILVWYFKSKKCIKPTGIYILAAVYCILNIGMEIVEIGGILLGGASAYTKSFDDYNYLLQKSITAGLTVLVVGAMSILLCFFARELYKKRRIAGR